MEETDDKLLDWALKALSMNDQAGAARIYTQYADRVSGDHPQLAEIYRRVAHSIQSTEFDRGRLIEDATQLGRATNPSIAVIDRTLAAATELQSRGEGSMFVPTILEVLYSYSRMMVNDIDAMRRRNGRIHADDAETLTDILDRMRFATRRLTHAIKGD